MAILGRFIGCAVGVSVVAPCGGGAAVPPLAETPTARQTGPAATAAPAATTARPLSTAAPTTGSLASIALSVTITQAAYGSVRARTAPDATCSASARLPSGATSTGSRYSPSRRERKHQLDVPDRLQYGQRNGHVFRDLLIWRTEQDGNSALHRPVSQPTNAPHDEGVGS